MRLAVATKFAPKRVRVNLHRDLTIKSGCSRRFAECSSLGSAKLALSLLLVICSSAAAEQHSDNSIKGAVNKSLKLIEKSAARYIEERSCFTCHHQALPAMTFSLASIHGFEVNSTSRRAQSDFTFGYFKQRIDRIISGNGVPGGPYTAGYALLSLQADSWPSDETTDALGSYLLQNQSKDGSWRIRTHRPPLEDSDFTATALSIRGLQLYPSKDRSEEIDAAIENAAKWLIQTSTASQEDRVFQLQGLDWSKADKENIEAAVDEILRCQNEDGGWSQLSTMQSDAYATGQSLVALHQAGKLATKHEGYQRGVRFLLESQGDDGSWFVETRSKPIQEYFESDFPHGKSQFISISGTCWATMALVLTIEM